MSSAMEIDPPVGHRQNHPKRARSEQSNDQAPQLDQHLIFDTNTYREGRRRVHVVACEGGGSSSSTYTFGEWMDARVLLWKGNDHALHVTVVKAVS